MQSSTSAILDQASSCVKLIELVIEVRRVLKDHFLKRRRKRSYRQMDLSARLRRGVTPG